MNNLDKKKRKLRKKYLKIRTKINNKIEKSDIIFNKIIMMEEYNNAKVIAIYKNLASEVDTSKLIEYSILNNRIVVLPRVKDNDLYFYKISSLNDKFEKSKFGVEEPLDDKNNLINPDMIDLIIIPGICFDKDRNRLGFGKGYYDRFLENKNIKSIAICFDKQILKYRKIPITNTDIKVDKIVTERSIYL